jgi:ABC-type multidrug transport system permease subunit
MRSLWLLTVKNLRVLVRSKSSALIVFLAPLLIILILGLSYNTSSQYGINIGIYSESFSEDVTSLVDLLQEQEFEVVKYESSVDDCIEDIKSGLVHACVSVPSSLSVEDNTAKEVTFYLDPSKINLVWMIQETLKSKFNLQSQQMSEDLTNDMLSKLNDAKTKINDKLSELNTIKEKTSSASSSANAVKSGLGGLDLSTPESEYNLSGVSSEITESLTKLEAAIDAVEDSEINSSVKSSIKSKLNYVKNLLDGGSNATSTGLGSVLSSLISDLGSATNKLSTASSTVGETTSSLSSVVTALNEGLGSLESLQTTLTEVHDNLAGQKVTEAGTIAQPLITKIEKVGRGETYLNFTFPALLVLVIMFSSLLLGTTLVMMEKHSPAFLRNFFLPIKKVTFIASIYLTNLVLILVQILIILGVSLFFMKDTLYLLPLVALILFISASVFTFLGMTVGYIFRSEETGVLASISLGSLLMFLSGVILPLESVSPFLRSITYFNPFVIAEKLIREVFLFGSSIEVLWMDLLMLFGYVVILFLVILILESLLHKHLMHRFIRHHHNKHRQKQLKKKNGY